MSATIPFDVIESRVIGTTTSLAAIADEYEVDPNDLEHGLAQRRCVICPGCGWWSHSWHPDSFCEDCGADDDE